MDLDWEKLVKRYVWHDERTPYFTRVTRLTPRQAHYELFGYALFVGILAGALSVAAFSSGLPHGDAPGVSLYAFSVCCAAVLLGATRHPWAALWCSSLPLAALVYFAWYGFHPALGNVDKMVMVAVILAWLLYAQRPIRIARNWSALAGPTEPD